MHLNIVPAIAGPGAKPAAVALYWINEACYFSENENEMCYILTFVLQYK